MRARKYFLPVMFRCAASALAIATHAAMLAPPAAAATIPPNDDFANAAVLDGALPLTAAGDNVGATKEAGEPAHGGDAGGASVWYRWTAGEPAHVSVETCRSDFDTLLAVYSGQGVDALTEVASNDEGCGSQSIVSFLAEAGTTYHIAVDGYAGTQGRIDLTLQVLHRPANDDAADARVLRDTLPIFAAGTNEGATREEGEHDHTGNAGGRSVWYRWTAPSTLPVQVATCGSTFDTLLAVYTGVPLHGLQEVASDADNSCDFGDSIVTFVATQGTEYWIAVDGYSAGAGAIELTLRVPAPPPNDHFANAAVLAGPLPVTALGSSVDATHEPGEPSDYTGLGQGSSIWYSWMAPTSGLVTAQTCGTEFPSLLGVWTGSSIDTLQRVPSDNNTCGDGTTITFQAAAGTTYRMAVDGSIGVAVSRGATRLTVRPAARPSNDDFDDALAIDGSLPIVVTGSNVDATREPSEPEPVHRTGDSARTSVWYRWTPSVSQPVTIETCGSTFETQLGVYRGVTLDALEQVAKSDDGCADQSRDTFMAVAGETYRIAVDGLYGDQGEFSLTVRNVAAPRHDDFADAQVLDGRIPIHVLGSNVDATAEAGEPNHAGASPDSSVWYRWTPKVSGPVAIETCGSTFDTMLGVYTGDEVAALTDVASDDDTCGLQSAVTFTAHAGTPYSIAVDAFGGPYQGAGAFTLTIRRPDPPRNDDHARAQRLEGPLPITVEGRNVDATAEPGEPYPGSAAGASIWYRWTPRRSSQVTIETCGSGFETAMAVYTGSSLRDLERVSHGENSACVGRSRVTFVAVANTTYWIAIDGIGGFEASSGGVGTVSLTVTCRGADECDEAPRERGRDDVRRGDNASSRRAAKALSTSRT